MPKMTHQSYISHIPDIDGSVLKSAREAQRLNQEQLARTLCLSRKHIDQLETNGHSSFFSLKHRYQVAMKVAKYLGLEPADILIGEVEEAPQLAEDVLVENQEELTPPVVQQSPIFETDETAIATTNEESRRGSFVKLRYIAILMSMAALSYGAAEFFKNWNEEQLKVPSIDLVENAKGSVVDTALPTINAVDVCDVSRVSALPSVSVEAPNKKGDNVFIVSKSEQPVCIVDSSKKATSLNLAADAKQTVSGQAPFIVNAKDLSGLEIYFQGRKVKYADGAQGPIKLVESPFKE